MGTTTPYSDLPYAVVSVKVERETFERFRKIARSEHRTVSGELRRLIDQRLADEDPEPESVAA